MTIRKQTIDRIGRTMSLAVARKLTAFGRRNVSGFALIQFLAVFMAAGYLPAMPSGIAIDRDGNLQVAGMKMQIQHCDQKWNATFKNGKTVTAAPGYPARSDCNYELTGRFDVGGENSFQLHETVRERGPDRIRYHITLLSSPGIPAKSLMAKFTLPHDRFGRKNIKLDGRSFPVGTSSGLQRGVKTIELENNGKRLVFTGNFDVSIEDKYKSRGWKFSLLQLDLAPGRGLIHKAELEFELKTVPLESRIWDFSRDPNAVKDASALALAGQLSLPVGTLDVDQFSFPMPKAGTRGALLGLGAGQSAVWKFTPSAEPRFLDLIHWVSDSGARPEIVFSGADGKSSTVGLANGSDFDLGRPMVRRSNYAVTSSNDQTLAGTGFSSFPIAPGVGQVVLRNSGGGRWIVAGAVMTSASVSPKAVDSVTYIRSGGDWVPFETMKPVRPGSVLDMSDTLDAPAGKYGWIGIDGQGHFVAEKAPDRRLRFLGTNYAMFGADLKAEEARQTVAELAALGYNAVRVHLQPLLIAGNAQSQLDFDAEKFKQIDYFYSLLKNKGMYLIIDLRCRRIRNSDLPGLPGRGKSLGGILPISSEARTFWKQFARKLFTHYNPYTGLKYCDDPAFFAVILNNEDDIYTSWKTNPEMEQLYLNGYREYLRTQNLLSDENLARRDGLFLDYLGSLYVKMVREFTDFLRRELGYKGLITDFNFRSRYIDNKVRNELDFVDNHCYWDHPRFADGHSWSFPYLHGQSSAVRSSAWNPRNVFATRIFGKPFVLSEENYVFPNRYRGEGGPLLGGYAALQDWDGIFQFAWSHDKAGVRHERPINRFDISQDSLAQISQRIIWFLFLRGDLTPARSAVGWEFGAQSFASLADVKAAFFPGDFELLGLYCRIGSIAEDRHWPGVRRIVGNGRDLRRQLTAEENRFLDAGSKISENGQIDLNAAAGTCRVVTGRTESLTLPKGALTGKVLSVCRADSFQIVTAVALDRAELKNSGKILLFHQSDLTNDGIRFRSESMQAVDAWGQNRQLIRRASAEAGLTLADGFYRIRSIGIDGRVKSDVPAKYEQGTLRFTLDTARDGGTMIYLIERSETP